MLYITYDNNHLKDGFGAQYQRILGIYCIAKEFGLGYLHTGFQDIEYQGLLSLINGATKDFVDLCNQRTFIPSDDVPTEDWLVDHTKVVHIKNLTFHTLMRYIRRCKTETMLLRVAFPFGLTNAKPEIYRHAKGLYQPMIKRNKTLTVGVHVRRGELHAVDSDRMLPDQYYIDVVRHVYFALNEPCVIELYTEVAPKTICVDASVHGLAHVKGQQTIGVDSTDPFNALPNLVKYINEDALDTFDRMINCDVLVASRSSFSTCASYIKQGVTIYHPFWSSMLPNDIPYTQIDRIRDHLHGIPKTVYQVWMQGSDKLPTYVKDNVMELNAGYSYEFYDETACREFLRHYYDEETLRVFDNLGRLNPKHQHQFRCDFFRYCLLYLRGGVYLDVDLQPLIGFDQMQSLTTSPHERSDFITALGAHSNPAFGECTNGFIMCTRGNPIFLKLIDYIKANQQPPSFGDYVKNLFQTLRPETIWKKFTRDGKKCYLFSEIKKEGKYYISSDRGIIMNSNGHNYLS
jgi:hypothetical protein